MGDAPPQEWADALRILAGETRRIALAWRRGSGPYVPIPGATVELPEIVGKTGDEIADERRTDPTRWANENARQRWSVACEWAKKNGPVIDVQLQLWGFDKKKGVFKILKGGLIAKRVNLTGEGAAWMDDGQTTERVMFALVDRLITAIEKRDDKYNALQDAIAKHYAGIGQLTAGTLQAFERAMGLREQSAASAAGARAADRAFMVELAKIRATEQGVNNAVSQIGPAIRDIFRDWQTRPSTPPHQEIAAKLLASISDDQRAAWKAAGFDTLLADIESALKQVQASASVEAAVATMRAVAPSMVANQAAIGNLLSQQQRDLALQLLQLPGVFE